MALTALIAAYRDSAEDGVLRAVLPLAGRTVIERQAKLAAAAGATRILVVVERMPAELSGALDRIRREGQALHVARGAAEVAALLGEEEPVLLLADGAVTEPDRLRDLARHQGPTLLSVPEAGLGETYERIDARSRWSGIGLVGSGAVRATAEMVGDWDLVSTLLRRALQSGIPVRPAQGQVAILDSRGEAATFERRIVDSAITARDSWISVLLAPAEQAGTLRLLDSPLGPPAVAGAGIGLSLLAVPAFLQHWLWPGLALMLLATPLHGIARRLARIRLSGDGEGGWTEPLLAALAGAGLLALSWALAEEGGWGFVLMGLVTIAFMLALGIERQAKASEPSLLLAEPKGMTWLLLPFALLGWWPAGLATLFAYAAGSFFWAQHEAHRPPAAP